jgi:hypothetical protein
MEIKKYEDILKLHTWFAAQVTKGLDARIKTVPKIAEQLSAASGAERPAVKSGKAKKKARVAKHK